MWTRLNRNERLVDEIAARRRQMTIRNSAHLGLLLLLLLLMVVVVLRTVAELMMPE